MKKKRIYNRWWFRGLCIAATSVIAVMLVFLLLPRQHIGVSNKYLNIALAADGGEEVVGMRTRGSKTYWQGGDSYSLDSIIGAVHYDDEGDWVNIDNEFAPAQAPWYYEMLNAGYHVRVKELFTDGQILQFEKQGYAVEFQPMNLEWTNDLDQIELVSIPQEVTPVVSNPIENIFPEVNHTNHLGTIRWDNAYGSGRHFQWQCTRTRLVKVLEIDSFASLPTPPQFIIDGGNPVLRLSLIFDPPPKQDVDILVDGEVWGQASKVQTINNIEFRQDGEVLWSFSPLMFWDSENDVQQSVATLDKVGNKLYISIRVPYNWLQNATYPIFIDTSVDETVPTEADDAYAYTGYFSVGSYMFIGTTAIGYQARDTYRFTTVTISDGATMDNGCYLSLWTYYAASGGARTNLAADDQQDPDAPTDETEIFAITPTSASIAWDEIPDADDYENSPEIKTVIQELVDSYDYSGGSYPIQIILDGDGVSNQRTSGYGAGTSGKEPKMHLEYSTGAEPDISNVGGDWSIGVVDTSTTYWANGSEPSFPLTDGDAKWTVTNNSGASIDIDIKGTNFTGGVGWTLAGSQGENQVVLVAFKEGDGSGDGITLTTSDQLFIDGLADSADIDWELKFLSATSHTDGVEKSATVTITAELE